MYVGCASAERKDVRALLLAIITDLDAPLTLIHTHKHFLTMSSQSSESDDSDCNEGMYMYFVPRGGSYIHGVWRAVGDTTPIIHPAYTNEQDSGEDLVIQTTDNILFHIHSYYLKAAR
jgi:hypothetical protein